MGLLKKVYRKLLGSGKPDNTVSKQLYIQSGDSSLTDSIKLSNRSKNEAIRLVIGDDSVVSGSYIFENDEGVVKIGSRTFVGGGCKFICINSITVGDDVLISWGCTFMDNNAHSIYWEERKNDVKDWKKGIVEGAIGKYKNWDKVESKPIIIGDKAWIGFDVVIMKGVVIGERAVIAAGSVVVTDVPADSVYAGNPAKEVKKIIQ